MWRSLTNAEISQLIQQNNSADDWNDISVVRTFSVLNIHNCHFHGKVNIEDNVVMSNVLHIANYHIGSNTRISNIGTLTFTEEHYGYPLELCNEDGRFQAVAIPEMNSTDVFQCLYTGNPAMFEHEAPTEKQGYIGTHCTIENVTAIRNVHIDAFAELSGCCEIEHAWISSSEEEPSRIGSAVILRNAILNKGAHIDSRAYLANVLVGQQVSIAEGARVYQSAVGDNSHISGCELGHSFLYPCHEQHHSNSFLIAAHIQGQSNIAAGATLGSNHNGRKNDVDLVAGRGFWPGLCSSLAFPCSFAPYTLVAKGAYPRPLHIPFAFSLINNNVQENCLEIMPAFWWMHNAYAMMRNEWKYQNRDKRKTYTQYYDYKPLAPDTIHIVMENHRLLTRHLAGEAELPKMEMSNRPVRILKEKEAVAAYREMMLCYILAEGVFNNKPETLIELSDHTELQWVNAGGNVLTAEQWTAICNASSLKESHELQLEYVDENFSFVHFQDAVNILAYLCDGEVTVSRILSLCKEAIDAQVLFYERVITERKKDMTSEFRQTNPLFPYKTKDAMDDNICQKAAEEIAKLERLLHI
jgi:bifunctional N-acetylglucosamine-1-phosphate-uridyltransferase/glucosamine-1-phosphate-acetyltransferase GlmU-like protein